MQRAVTASLASLLLVSACASTTAVETTPDFTPAQLEPAVAELAPPAAPPPRQPRTHGAQAVANAARGAVVQPTDLDMDGTVWRVRGIDPTKIYQIPVNPRVPAVVLFPPNETLVSGLIPKGAQGTNDFTMEVATTGNRAAVVVMAECAAPTTQRYSLESETPIRPCLSGRSRSTFVTSGGVYHVELLVTDWTTAATTEFNHAAPPPTNVAGTQGHPPIPRGPRDMLFIRTVSEQEAPWAPTSAWADPVQLVIQFPAPLPTLPALFAGQKGEKTINYRVVRTGDAVFLVTDRRVTEAALRLGQQEVRISAEAPETRRQTTRERPDPRFERRN